MGKLATRLVGDVGKYVMTRCRRSSDNCGSWLVGQSWCN